MFEPYDGTESFSWGNVEEGKSREKMENSATSPEGGYFALLEVSPLFLVERSASTKLCEALLCRVRSRFGLLMVQEGFQDLVRILAMSPEGGYLALLEPSPFFGDPTFSSRGSGARVLVFLGLGFGFKPECTGYFVFRDMARIYLALCHFCSHQLSEPLFWVSKHLFVRH